MEKEIQEMLAAIDNSLKRMNSRLERIIKDTERKQAEVEELRKKGLNDNAYKSTIHRLDAIPDLKKRIEKNRAKLETALATGQGQGHSTSIVRYHPGSGVRVDPEEAYDALVQDLQARIDMDTAEVKEVTEALETVKNDYYYETVYDRFVLGNKDDDDIALSLSCDASTVRRNRKRLIRRIAILLYGVEAI